MRLISPSKETLRHAGELAEQYALRGYDAVHLATALTAQSPNLAMITWDEDLAEAAVSEGCNVIGSTGRES